MTVDKIKMLLEIREEGRQMKTGGKRERMMKDRDGHVANCEGKLLKTVISDFKTHQWISVEMFSEFTKD